MPPYSEPGTATPEVQHIATQVKAEFERQAHMTCGTFKAILYRYQKPGGPSSGTNFLIKVQVSDDAYVHLKVFQSLPHENQGPSLVSFQTGKTKDDPLTYF